MNSPITLDALKVLDAIERKKSFASAADALFRVPSAISYTVSKLEEDLGVAVFDRSKRKAELTAVGKLIVEQGRLILQATEELTNMAKQSADGWEVELRISIDSVLPFHPIFTLVAEFQALHPWIDIKITEEVFGGTWDALNTGRCDLIIGAQNTITDNNFNTYHLGEMNFVFAVAKDHPLCNEQPPLLTKMIKQYPAVVVADSSRELIARSAGLLDGQARITVSSIDKKIEAQLLGLGVGYLPVTRIQKALQSGQLMQLAVKNPDNRELNMNMAWRKDNSGKALAWFVEKIQTLPTNVFFNAEV
jgi:DNA-binding transcriptional LysR family regulator